ncbi:glycosyltransferase family 2 protein [Methanobacterium sp.]|uniref:glycosyltransferase family 2 protein n=1 Tax=Methanobacterium sp. TaxID=2164 RepID=UPI003C76CD55
MTKITAILPAYNEEVSLGSIILNTKKYVDDVIVIDDGSTDNTVEIAQLAGAKVICHSSNKGKGAALKTGFKAAKDSEIIVTIDSDGQHNPEEIPKLLNPIINGKADVVNGSRYINGNKKDTPSYRRIGQTVLDKATNFNSGLDITDSQSGFRAFARHAVPAFRFSCIDFGIESEMLMDAANAGLRIKEVEISVRYDVDGSTKNPISHGVGVLMRVINDLEFQRPLYYFTLPGAIIIIIGVVLGLVFFGDYLGGATKSLAPTVIAIMMTMVGGFLAFTGIILDSMSRMINRVVNDSNYDIHTSDISSTEIKQHGK